MDDTQVVEYLESIDAKLTALVSLQTHRILIEDESLARPRPRSMDKMLHDAGLSQKQISAVLGKSVQAVGQMIAKG